MECTEGSLGLGKLRAQGRVAKLRHRPLGSNSPAFLGSILPLWGLQISDVWLPFCGGCYSGRGGALAGTEERQHPDTRKDISWATSSSGHRASETPGLG